MVTVTALKYEDIRPASNWIYLHGELDRINGHDLCKLEGIDLPPKDEDFGIHDVSVKIDSETYPGKLFLWKRRSPYWAGLVVSVNDLEYMADAQAKFDRREEDI